MPRPRTLLDDVEDFLLLYPEMTPARVGREGAGDKDLVFDLRRGRSPREDTVLRVRQWMARHKALASAKAAAMEPSRKRLEKSLRENGASAGD